LGAKIANRIISQAKQFGAGRISIVTQSGVYWNSEGCHPDHCEAEYNSFDNKVLTDVYKLIIEFDSEENAAKIAKGEGCVITKYSGERWFRFSPPEATKEYAIARLIEHLGLKAENVLCFGDDFSDVGMLREFIGVSVSNAVLEAKTVSMFGAGDNNKNGVAEFILDFIVKEGKK
jgi:hydroxymethylpyrimidine pyrophosphatase-like HAD family hydrolase